MRLSIIAAAMPAGISAALRAHQLRPDVAVVLADAFPNYSICCLPFYVRGETTDWRQLAHRREFPGIEILLDHRAERVEPGRRIVHAKSKAGDAVTLQYDKLIMATGARLALPAIPGIEPVHPMHTMADSFQVHEKVASGRIARAAIVGVGYFGVEMADALTHRRGCNRPPDQKSVGEARCEGSNRPRDR